MAIVYDSGNCVCSRAGGMSTAINITAGLTDSILVALWVESYSNIASNLTYGGVAMTWHSTTAIVAGPQTCQLWYMLNPPAGINNLVSDEPASCHQMALGGMVFSGVDLGNPFGPTIAHQWSVASPLNIVTQAGWMAFGMVMSTGQNPASVSCNVAAPTTSSCKCSNMTGTTGCHGIQFNTGYHDAAGATTTFDYTGNTHVGVWGFSLRPSVGLRARAVKYYFNIWDPKPEIKDVQGRVIPPDQLRGDSWLEMQGAKLPQSEIYDSFIEDPSKARIIEVATRGDSATLKASRSQFADVLIKRAASGRG